VTGEFAEPRSDFAELHDELRSVARDLLGKVAPPAPVDWGVLAASGWLGLEVPESLDGAGATFAEVAVILTEMGRAATCSPYLGAIVGGVGALTELAPGAGRDELLREAAAGEALPVAVLADGSADAIWADVGVADAGVADAGVADAEVGGAVGEGRVVGAPFRLERTPGGLRLHGRASFVPDAADASRLLVVALDPGGEAVLVDSRPGPFGIRVVDQPVVDASMAKAHASGLAVDVAGKAMQLHGASATPGRAGSTSTSSGRRSTGRCSARRWRIAGGWRRDIRFPTIVSDRSLLCCGRTYVVQLVHLG
jgi:alkylation response protein AidB-like acyl-CoA dehydrogenase